MPDALMLFAAGLIGMGFYLIVGKWSDRVGRKKPIILGAVLTLIMLFPIFWGIGALANPAMRDAARAAGVAPIRRGNPGYRPALDRDNDGVGCE